MARNRLPSTSRSLLWAKTYGDDSSSDPELELESEETDDDCPEPFADTGLVSGTLEGDTIGRMG